MARILYAEDDKDLSAMLIQWLKTLNHEVDDVTSGAEALEYLEYKEYDVVLLDWSLPGIDGVQVCEKFRAKNAQTPIILLTGRRERDTKEIGIKSGATRVCLKPPDLDVLKACIDDLVGGAQS